MRYYKLLELLFSTASVITSEAVAIVLSITIV